MSRSQGQSVKYWKITQTIYFPQACFRTTHFQEMRNHMPFWFRRYGYPRLRSQCVFSVSVSICTYKFQRFYRDLRCPLPCTHQFHYPVETCTPPYFKELRPLAILSQRGGTVKKRTGTRRAVVLSLLQYLSPSLRAWKVNLLVI